MLKGVRHLSSVNARATQAVEAGAKVMTHRHLIKFVFALMAGYLQLIERHHFSDEDQILPTKYLSRVVERLMPEQGRA